MLEVEISKHVADVLRPVSRVARSNEKMQPG
jgi:hypothetical protein